MSDYQDDIQETAVASDQTWLGLSAVSESVARASVAALFGLTVMHASEAVASDEVIDQPSHMVTETAQVADEVLDAVFAGSTVVEQARIAELFRHGVRVEHVAMATISDAVQEAIGATTTEQASISTEVLDNRITLQWVEEQATIRDFTGQFASVLVEEQVSVTDTVVGRLRRNELLQDEAGIAVDLLDEYRARPPVLEDQALVSAGTWGALHAADQIIEVAVAEDMPAGGGLEAGQAWTCNMDAWSMSRYTPYGFSRLAVINGVIYGEAEDGVYALDGGDDEITGELVTGNLDMSGGPLARLPSAYLEYSLDGTAKMEVTSTQTGQPETYSYDLPAEDAEHLTNGRFLFGRGLRGRHFSFKLRMTGQHGHIDDLTVQAEQTKRRV